MNSSKNYYSTDRTFMTMMVLALLSGFVFFATNSLDFLITAFTYGRFSLSNIAYFFDKTVLSIAIPLLFVIPSMKPTGKIKAEKIMFIAFGILHLLSLSWVISFIIEEGFFALFDNDALKAFQTSDQSPVVSNIIYWDTYSWFGIVFSLVFSGLCIFTGFMLDDVKGRVCGLLTGITVFRIGAPLVLDLIMKREFFSGLWLTNNYVDIVCWLLITMAAFVASRYDETWIALVWGQEIPQSEDE